MPESKPREKSLRCGNSSGRIAVLRIISGALILSVALANSLTAAAQQLLMFESEDCPWCEQWTEEVGVIYEKTEEGQRLPLKRIDFYAGMASNIKLREPVRFTPTFVVVRDGQEIGRINGYPGEENFWGLLGVLIRKLEE